MNKKITKTKDTIVIKTQTLNDILNHVNGRVMVENIISRIDKNISYTVAQISVCKSYLTLPNKLLFYGRESIIDIKNSLKREMVLLKLYEKRKKKLLEYLELAKVDDYRDM
jgi:hypothetical protein